MFLSVLISIISAGIVLAGLMALLRGPKRAQNRWFFIFTIFLAVWIVSNFLDSNFVNSTTDILLKIDFSSILFTAWALLQFTLVFLIRNADKKRLIHTPTFTITSFLLNVMFSLLIFLNLVVTGDISTGKLIVDYMSLSWAYIFVFLAYHSYA